MRRGGASILHNPHLGDGMTELSVLHPAPTMPGLSAEALGRLMPMFLWLDARGRICGLGPTLKKILGSRVQIGSDFAQHFVLRRTRDVGRGGGGRDSLGAARRLCVSLVAYPEFSLRGTAVEIGAPGGGAVLLNLSFGIFLAEAVREFGLTEADFAASDLAMEMLYLIEAKAAVLRELTALTARLDQQRQSAMSQALTDPLTGLANRRAFDAALERALQAQAQSARPFALAHLDLDFFKQVNDTLGHAAGDAVLLHCAEVLAAEVRRGDLVARVGGDEFVLLLRGITGRDQLTMLCERMIARIEEPILFEGRSCHVSASIGVAVSSGYAAGDADRLLAAADAALYQSKHRGRGRCSFYTG